MSQELDDVLNTLEKLTPGPKEGPQPTDQAWRKLNMTLKSEPAASPRPLLRYWLRRFDNMLTFNQKLARFGAVGVLALLIAFFGFSPTGQALASDFLGIFRVEKFAPISISPERLAELEEMNFEGLFPGELTWTAEPTEPIESTSFAEAADSAGFTPFGANLVADLGDPNMIMVGGAANGQMVVDLDAARAMLNIAGVDASLLPDTLDGAEISIATETGIVANWDGNNITLIQMPSPEINYPSNFDPAPVGQALLQFLGIEETEAARMAQTIDWTNTLILPFPEGFGDIEEVTINGNSGILLTANSDLGRFDDHPEHNSNRAPSSTLIWEANGMLHMLTGNDTTTLLNLANQ